MLIGFFTVATFFYSGFLIDVQSLQASILPSSESEFLSIYYSALKNPMEKGG